MGGNSKVSRPKDYSTVNVNDPDEMLYWTKELGVSNELIAAAVKNVGTSIAAVRRNIRLNRKGGKQFL